MTIVVVVLAVVVLAAAGGYRAGIHMAMAALHDGAARRMSSAEFDKFGRLMELALDTETEEVQV